MPTNCDVSADAVVLARTAAKIDPRAAVSASLRYYEIRACAVLRLQLANETQQNLDGFMVQFNKNAHGLAPVSQVFHLRLDL